MSLHIVAYRHLTALPLGTPQEDDDQFDTRVGYYDNPDFPGRSAGIDCTRVYRVDDPKRDVFDFEAGSYGGYGMWREQLARLAGYPMVDDGRPSAARWAWDHPDLAAEKPFVELINFADNEGTIGPLASRALVTDFEQWIDRAWRYQPTTEGSRDAAWFYDKYIDWYRAFTFAADGGAVKFA